MQLVLKSGIDIFRGECPIRFGADKKIGDGESGTSVDALGGGVQADLTPSSVFLTGDNLPKLANFRPIGAGRGNMLGARTFTPGYAAPEEVLDSEGVEPTPAVDVYRVGAVLYAMVTGRPPFSRGGDLIETIRDMLDQSPAPVRQWNPEVSADLQAVCMECLEKQPAYRYAESGDLVDVLGNFYTPQLY